MRYVITPPQAVFERGRRSNQEDSIWPSKGTATVGDRLFMVCDGMGGHESGEVASTIVCHTVASFIDSAIANGNDFCEDLLRDALSAAYDELDTNDKSDDSVQRMGTTLALLYMGRDGVTAAHIGDSRIYHIRPSQREILFRSRDHSLVYELFQAGEITEEQMASHPQRNIITRCMMPHQGQRCAPEVHRIDDVRPNDYFFICSDGMLERLADNQLVDIISDDDETDEMKAVILRKYTADNSDNHSAYLIHVKEVVQEISDVKPARAIPVEMKPQGMGFVNATPTSNKKRNGFWLWFTAMLIAFVIVLAVFGVYKYVVSSNNDFKSTPRVETDFQDPQKKQNKKQPQRSVKKENAGRQQNKKQGDEATKAKEEKPSRPLFMDENSDNDDKDAMEKMRDNTPKKKEEQTKSYKSVSI